MIAQTKKGDAIMRILIGLGLEFQAMLFWLNKKHCSYLFDG
jgi:hypothetical protein